jgi:hypothetical protein
VTAPYENYWQKKALRERAPAFAVKRWWPSPGLSETEALYLDAVSGAKSLLDIGAGDLTLKKKLTAAGFKGEYRTQDVGHEAAYDYRDLGAIDRRFDAVLCLDVIEHLPLADGLALLDRAVALLEPGGVLVLQTPNARCVRHPLSWDMTHLHCYNLPDLWAHVGTLGLEATGYRIVLERGPSKGLLERVNAFFARFVITRLLGADYADNIALIARKKRA